MRDRGDAVPSDLPVPLPAESLPEDGGQFAAERSKFDLAGDAPRPEPQSLPWGYAENRIVGIARDPYYLYVYWEVLDEAIASARARLGDGGPDAWFILRVYDTTGVTFNGLNANSYFDIGVDRIWNNYFIKVDAPRRTFHIDLGLKSREGYFQVIARTGAVEMPADGIAADGRVEWMTVEPDPAYARKPSYRHRFTPRPGGGGGSGGGRTVPLSESSHWPKDERLERSLSALLGFEITRGEWFEEILGGRVVRWVRWEGARKRTEWRAGPFTIPFTFSGPIEIMIEGERKILEAIPGGPRLVFGPWRVVILGIGARGERRILDAWKIHYTWSTGGGYERVETPALYRYIYGSYLRRAVLGHGSESLILEQSGASELLVGGASERMWTGSSELMFQGASETLFQGASGLQLGGASQYLLGGASEYAFAGGSETFFLGASELRLGGASEGLLGGASDQRSVGSSAAPGAPGFHAPAQPEVPPEPPPPATAGPARRLSTKAEPLPPARPAAPRRGVRVPNAARFRAESAKATTAAPKSKRRNDGPRTPIAGKASRKVAGGRKPKDARKRT